jgi:parvulin-like peptidyl-prolyl isomerase
MAQSYDPTALALASYIDTLESYRDYERYGRDLSINEGGRFTRDGYIAADWQGFRRVYDGQVPEQYRLRPYLIRPPARNRARYTKQKRQTAPARGGGRGERIQV